MPLAFAAGIALFFFPSVSEAHMGDIVGTGTFGILREPLLWLLLISTFAILGGAVSPLSRIGNVQTIPERGAGHGAPRTLAVLLGSALIYQMFHMAEHIAQVYQYWYLGMRAADAQGILWFLDIEWNHFLFNAGYFALGAVFVIGLLRYLKRRGIALHWIGRALLTGFLILQGWHLIEHTVRIIEHVTVGCEPCPGILDRLFGWGLIALHYWFNLAALTITVGLSVWFGFHRRWLPAREEIRSPWLRHCCDVGMPALFSFSATVLVMMQVVG